LNAQNQFCINLKHHDLFLGFATIDLRTSKKTEKEITDTFLLENEDKISGQVHYTRNCIVIPFVPNSGNFRKDIDIDETPLGYIIYKSNGQYMVQFFLTGPKYLSEEVNNTLDDLLQSTRFVNPIEIDQHEGLPVIHISPEEYLEMQLKKVKKEMSEIYPEMNSDPMFQENIETEFSDLFWKRAQYQFSFERYFNSKENIQFGHEPLDYWFDYHFYQKKFPDLEYFNKFRDASHGEEEDGIEMAIDSLVRSIQIIPENYKVEFTISDIDSIPSGNKFFIFAVAAEPDGHFNISCLIPFAHQNGKWTQQPSLSNIQTERDFLSEYGYYNRLEIKSVPLKNKSENYFVVAEDPRQHLIYLFSDNYAHSEYVRVYADTTNQFEVEFYLRSFEDQIRIGSINFYESIEKKIHYDEKNVDAQFIYRMKDEDIFTSYYLEDGSFEDRVDAYKLYHVGKKILVNELPLDKRGYTTQLKFGDLNKNGISDCYSFTVSNGKIVHYEVYELTKDGVIQLPSNDQLFKLILGTAEFQKVKEISLGNVMLEWD
jgi:hypothetical protein